MPIIQFKGKSAVESYHHTVPHHQLEFDEKLSVLTRGDRSALDGNLIVEGDNLLALKALLPTHAGRIKCVYIDPPYNTGNEGWVYNDNLTQSQFKEWIGRVVGKEGEDATRHDKWCCMMYPRLALLRELMADDGAIFVSIDDNEVHALRMLMDEIFGENNFVTTIIWEKIYSPRSSAKYFFENHDYIVCYARSKVEWERKLLPRTEESDERYSNPDNDSRGPWKPSDLSARNYYSLGTYPITCPSGRVISGPPAGRYWVVSPEKFQKLDAEKRIWWGSKGDNVPAIKRFLSDVKSGIVPKTIWTYKEVGHTQDAKKEILEIFEGKMVFMTPKPVTLLRRIIEISTDDGDYILDSFAGSGTTGHAVLDVNKSQGTDRKFVLVQMAHDTKEDADQHADICKTVTAERVKRVIKGYSFTRRKPDGSEKVEKVTGLGGSFSYVVLGPALLGEYRELGPRLPSYDELAKYVFYTETSREFDPSGIDAASGKIGQYKGTSYYLLYTTDPAESRALDLKWLKALGKSEKNRSLVIYCEKLWVHRDDMAKYELDTGRKIRPMVIPFNLK